MLAAGRKHTDESLGQMPAIKALRCNGWVFRLRGLPQKHLQSNVWSLFELMDATVVHRLKTAKRCCKWGKLAACQFWARHCCHERSLSERIDASAAHHLKQQNWGCKRGMNAAGRI